MSALHKGIILLTLISWAHSKACYLNNDDASIENTCGRRFYPILKIHGVYPYYGKVDTGIFLKGNVLKRYSEDAGGERSTEYQDEKALLDLKNRPEPETCDGRPVGTAGKKMIFKGKVPIDLSALLDEAVNADGGDKFDTTGKKLVYKGLVPIDIKNLKNGL